MPGTSRPEPPPLPPMEGRHPDCVLRDGRLKTPDGARVRTPCLFTEGIWQSLCPPLLVTSPIRPPLPPWSLMGRGRPVYIRTWQSESSGEKYCTTCTSLNKSVYNVRFSIHSYTFTGPPTRPASVFVHRVTGSAQGKDCSTSSSANREEEPRPWDPGQTRTNVRGKNVEET